jgi:hypothetical protein
LTIGGSASLRMPTETILAVGTFFPSRQLEQNDTNRGNPHKTISYGCTMYEDGCCCPPPNSHKWPEVPMNTPDELLLLWPALHRLEATYWYDVDFNEGRTAHEFFTPDGVKVVGHNRFEGREEIRNFYEWRESSASTRG